MKLHLPKLLAAALLAACTAFALNTTAAAADTGTATFTGGTSYDRGGQILDGLYLTKTMTTGTATSNALALDNPVNIYPGGDFCAGDYTVSIWMTRDSLATSGLIFAYGGTRPTTDNYGANGFSWDADNQQLRIYDGKINEAFTGMATESRGTVSESLTIGTGNMVNITIAVDGVNQHQTPVIWVNGVKQATPAEYNGNMNYTADPMNLYAASGITYGNITITNTQLTEQADIYALMGVSKDQPEPITEYVWKGTSENHDWSSAVWNEAVNFGENGAAVFNSNGHELVTLSGTQTASSISISNKTYTFEGDGTLTVTGEVKVNEGAGLELNSAAVAQAMLPKVSGTGSVALNAVLELGSGFAPTSTGELTINKSRSDGGSYDLKLSGGNNATHDFSRFSKVKLADGVAIEYNSGTTTMNNVTLLGDASFNIFDMGVDGTKGLSLKGTTALDGHTLSFNNTNGQSWKRKVSIDQLTGTKDSSLVFLGGATADGKGSKLIISSLQGFSGTLKLDEKDAGNAVQATVYGGDGNAVSFKALDMLGASEATFRARENNTGAPSYSIETVTMDAGAKLLSYNATWNSSAYDSVNLTIGKLVMNGDTATVGTTNHGGLVNIRAIDGEGTLTLTYESSSDVKTVFNVGGTDVKETTFSGTLDVYHNNGGSKRNTTLILNDEYTAADAVVQFRAVGAGSNPRALGIGIHAETVKVAGLNDGDIGSTTGNNLYALYSGDYNGLSNQYNGGTDFYENAGDGETRTLEITGDGDYSTNIKVLDHVNILMSGSGTQTFNGDMSSFNGSLALKAGTVVLNSALGASAQVSVEGDATLVGKTGGIAMSIAAGTTATIKDEEGFSPKDSGITFTSVDNIVTIENTGNQEIAYSLGEANAKVTADSMGAMAESDVTVNNRVVVNSIFNIGEAVTLTNVDTKALSEIENYGGKVTLQNVGSDPIEIASITLYETTVAAYADGSTTTEATITITEAMNAGEGALLANLRLADDSLLNLDVSTQQGAYVKALTLGSQFGIEDGGHVNLSEGVIDALKGMNAGDTLDLVVAAEQTELTYFAQYNGLGYDDLFVHVDGLDGNYVVYANEKAFGLTKQGAVPEPTTGTLSLLALMALAARRRRK